MTLITRLKLKKIGKRLTAAHGIAFEFDDDVVDRIAERCTEVDTGARNIDFIIDRTLLPEASRALLAQMASEQMPDRLTLGLDDAGNFTYAFDGERVPTAPSGNGQAEEATSEPEPADAPADDAS